MKSKLSNSIYHILFWIFIAISIILIMGNSWGSMREAIYYIILLLPIIMGTSYFFNYYLVPVFLLKKKYFSFGLYFFYSLIISLYLEIIVLTVSFVYLANFKIERMGNSSDTMLLALLMYMVMFLGSFLLTIQKLTDSQRKIKILIDEKAKENNPFMELLSNRRQIRIPFESILFIESMADYIKVNSVSEEGIISKEKISFVEKKLPVNFLRIHRSFIVNTKKITRYNSDEIEIEGVILKIGRTYKKKVHQKLKPAEFEYS